jgi:hypothetical protein
MSSNPEFAGDYPKFLDVDSNEQRTIDITGLEVPSDAQDGTIYKITVNVKRGSLDGGMSSASMYGVSEFKAESVSWFGWVRFIGRNRSELKRNPQPFV